MKYATASWLVPGMSKQMFTGTEPRAGTPVGPRLSRNAIIVGSVILLHVVALWALQNGLLHRAVAVFIPVQVLSEIVEPPLPVVPPPPPVQPPPKVRKQEVVKAKAPTPPPPPQLQAIANPDPAPNAPTAVTAPPAPLPPIATPVSVVDTPAAAAPSPPAPPAPPKIEPPSSDADYLQNPKQVYPAMSKRLLEQGTVLINVLVAADGTPQKVELRKSSGFVRLDRAALEFVERSRYAPGKRNGAPEAMWTVATVRWVLN